VQVFATYVSFLAVSMCVAIILISSVKIAICTSDEPVSPGKRCHVLIAAWMASWFSCGWFLQCRRWGGAIAVRSAAGQCARQLGNGTGRQWDSAPRRSHPERAECAHMFCRENACRTSAGISSAMSRILQITSPISLSASDRSSRGRTFPRTIVLSGRAAAHPSVCCAGSARGSRTHAARAFATNFSMG